MVISSSVCTACLPHGHDAIPRPTVDRSLQTGFRQEAREFLHGKASANRRDTVATTRPVKRQRKRCDPYSDGCQRARLQVGDHDADARKPVELSYQPHDGLPWEVVQDLAGHDDID